MADFTFNIAKGRVGYYSTLPGVSDGLVVVPIETAGLEADSTLKDYDTLALLLAGSSNEQTTMGRKMLSSVVATVDDANERLDVDAADFTWTAATGNPFSCVLICYDPDITSGADGEIIPLTKHDLVATPNGADIIVTVPVGGFWRGFLMATLLQDNFDRANSTTTIGSPQIGPAPTVLIGGGGIISNALYAPSLVSVFLWDLGTTDVELQADVSVTASNRYADIVFGAASTTDWTMVQFTDVAVEVYRQNSGGFSLLLDRNTGIPGTSTTIKASHKAGVIRAYVGGVQVLRFETDIPVVNTRHGIRLTHSQVRVDNLLGVDAPTVTDEQPTGLLPPAIRIPAAVGGDGFMYRGRDTKALDLAGVS